MNHRQCRNPDCSNRPAWRCDWCHQTGCIPPKSFLIDVFMSYVTTTPACWLWTGKVSTTGYGRIFRTNMFGGYAHRISYELFVGKIPEGLTLDHLCRNTLCVNPQHLEAVTDRENILRGTGVSARHAAATHCKRGHLKTLANTYFAPDGRPGICHPCCAERVRELHAKRKQHATA